MRRTTFSVSLGLLSVSLVGATARHASADTGTSLNGMEVEARALASDVPQVQITAAIGHQKLVDAIVAFRMGDYLKSSLTLFDLIGAKALVGPEAEQGTYYLAESLYLKGDRGAARTYYAQIQQLPASKYYRPAVIRLVEIAILQKDDATDFIAALDRTGNGPDISYIKGKYAFANGKFDDAIASFGQVPAGDPLALQAGYYSATASVAKNDLTRATQAYTDVANKKPKSANDRRVIELAQIALGRLYYQQDQFTQSITSYLLIDRKSDLFSEALYEVGWVYVKNKQFDKALKALELLAEADPSSQKTPTVKLLEGNLRIRKAQLLRKTEIEQTAGSPAATATANDITAEYDKASALFGGIHNAYAPAYAALKQVVDAKADPTPYVLQIAGRSNNYASTVPLPEVAQDWLKDDPSVDRFIQIESDLGQITADLDTSDNLIARLDAVLSAKDKSMLYPPIAQRRARVIQLEDDLIKVRSDLADQELRLVDSNGELSGLTAQRKTLGTQYANLGNPEQAYSERVTKAHADFDALDKGTAEIDAALTQSQAMAISLRKFSTDMQASDKPLGEDVKTSIATGLDSAAQEAQAIDTELASIKQEMQLGRDLAAQGDDQIMGARDLRKQLRGAIDAEHHVLAGFASASRDPGKSKNLAALADQAARVSQSLEQTEAQLDAAVQKGVDQTKTQLETEKQNSAQLRAELAGVEQEAKEASATVVADGFAKVKDRLYDVVIRADVGTVDVAWSQKSDTDDDLKRFNLNRTRELKQLKDEFKDILEGGVPRPSAPKKDEGMPKASQDPPQSPDSGKGGSRIKPVEQNPKKATDPTVKPDESKKTDPKKTGAH